MNDKVRRVLRSAKSASATNVAAMGVILTLGLLTITTLCSGYNTHVQKWESVHLGRVFDGLILPTLAPLGLLSIIFVMKMIYGKDGKWSKLWFAVVFLVLVAFVIAQYALIFGALWSFPGLLASVIVMMSLVITMWFERALRHKLNQMEEHESTNANTGDQTRTMPLPTTSPTGSTPSAPTRALY